MENKFLGLGKGIEIKKIKTSGSEKIQDIIPSEILLTIVLNDNEISTISCSPENEILLSIGYIVSNGYVKDYFNINSIRLCEEDFNNIREKNYDINLANNNTFTLNKRAIIDGNIKDNISILSDKNKFISAGCGDIDEFILKTKIVRVKSRSVFDSRIILELNRKAKASQKYKQKIGGLHSAALFDKNGNLLSLMEDLGRHNCIDKIIGYMLINEGNLTDKIIFTTGRLTIDIIYKICKVQIPVVATNSSISYSAAILAKKLNLTAIGYARGGRFNIYSCPERIF